jgi:hypothetical protein
MDDDIAMLKFKIDLMYQKQNELIERLNLIIERMNSIPKNISADNEHLMRKAFYLESEIDRLKRKTRTPDDE